MSNPVRFSPITFVLIIMIAGLVYLNWPAEQEAKKRAQRSTPVKVMTVEEQVFIDVVEGLGTAVANESVLLTAQQTDVIKEILFDDGELVTVNQLLLTLNDREERAQLNELDINLAEAKRQLKRISDLAKESVASEQLLDEQNARVHALKAQKEVAKARMSELELRAPFAGKLGIRQVSVGALVRPGDTITTLDDLSQIKVDFNIAENHLASVALGQIVTATSIAYPGETFTGRINSVDSRVDPETRSIQIRALVANDDLKLRPGMLLQIDLQKESVNTLVISEKSLIPNQNKQFVFVIEGGAAKQKEVTIGKRKPGVVQVLEGLSAGDQVVVEGTLRLRNGSKVKILNTVNGVN